MISENRDFLQRAWLAAEQAGHIFPEMAACEAALESGYGRSQLAIRDNNLFGCKQHFHPIYGTHILPTHEFLGNQWVTVSAKWVSYPDWAACFSDRMSTLKRLSIVQRTHGELTFPHYANALAAASATTYINEVSLTWASDPSRAEKVLAIYDEMSGDWPPLGS